jgi:hypothetical protein
MSAYPPPIIISTIYNPTFFEASVDTITQGQANALYLKKKTPDTATALETFSAGISTTTAGITGLATVGTTLGVTGVLTASSGVVTSNVNTGASTTLALGATDTIELGCGASRGTATVSIGTAGTGNVNISNAITNTVRLFSSSQGTNHQFDNINLIDTVSGAMSLFNTQVGGALNIGTSTSRTGAINLGTSSTNALPIGIGSLTSTTTIGTKLAITAAATSSSINTVTATHDLNIGGTQTSGVLNIGTAARVLTGNGGGINIGTGSSSVLNPINIGGIGSVLGLNGSTVTVGLNSNAINIGNGLSTTTINGNTSLATIYLDNVDRLTNGILSLGTSATSTSITVGSTSKQITVGALKINADANLVLDNVSATAEIYIGNNQVSGTGGISIGIGSGRSSNIAIGSTNASVIAIGGTGLTTIGTGGLALTSALTLPVSSYTPIAGTQLGGITTGSFPTSSSAFSTTKTVATLDVPTIGLYLCTFSFQVNFTVLPSANYITTSGTSTGFPAVVIGMNIITTGSNGGMSGSFFAKITAIGTLTLVYNVTGTVNSLSSNLYQIHRIA